MLVYRTRVSKVLLKLQVTNETGCTFGLPKSAIRIYTGAGCPGTLQLSNKP